MRTDMKCLAMNEFVVRYSPDDSRTNINFCLFPAFWQDRRALTAAGRRGSYRGYRRHDCDEAARPGLYGPEGSKIASGYPFGQFRTLIDIGGGQGHILAAILLAHKETRGTVFDIEPTAALARTFLLDRGLADRCDALGGSFFVNVPGGYDAYILKSILHDWDDAKATEILKICRQAIPQQSRLLVIEEVVVPRQIVGNPHRFVDLEMLVHFGGKERTESDYDKLMHSAKFSLERVVPIKGSFFSVIEGVPG